MQAQMKTNKTKTLPCAALVREEMCCSHGQEFNGKKVQSPKKSCNKKTLTMLGTNMRENKQITSTF